MAPVTQRKVDVRPEHWDNVFAPSSCLVVITTADKDGRVNAAAFGTCTRVCHDPVYISFTAGLIKDTYKNVEATGEFVVNVVPFEQEMLDKTLICGLPFAEGRNELDAAGLTALASKTVKPPRIAECRTHFECKVEWTRPWLHRVMICGRVEAVSIDEDCITDEGFIVWDKVKPAHYCGMRYKNHFVPAYEPAAGNWSYEGRDEEFRRDGEFPGASDWRNAYRSAD